jgi:prepilin-type N-terminal cleavage/methylation domain-containing protein
MSSKSTPTRPNSSAGFTIIELMIATMVFGVVLLMVTAGINHFFVSYYKSVTSSSVSNNARTITTDIERSVQLSSSLPDLKYTNAQDTTGYLCAGTEEYTFVLGVVESGSTHPLYRFSPASGSCNADPTSDSNYSQGTSLLGQNYRLIILNVATLSSNASLYAVNVKITYTDQGGNGTGISLVCAPASVSGSCNPSAADLSSFNYPDLACKSVTGSDFCDVAELRSVVDNRF